MAGEEFRERWVREKYLLLERAPEIHRRLAEAMEGRAQGPENWAELEALLEQGLAQGPTPESRIGAARAVWSRLEERAEGPLAVQARELIGNLADDPWAVVYLKKVFKILAARQGWQNLLKSSYLTD